MKNKAASISIFLALWLAVPVIAADRETPRVKASDTNGDGKPDKFYTFLKGRMLVLREYDRNFDGKIDRRVLTAWGTIKYGPGQPAMPGYVTLWREEDNDFDGKIDVYKERGSKNPSRDRIGKPIA